MLYSPDLQLPRQQPAEGGKKEKHPNKQATPQPKKHPKQQPGFPSIKKLLLAEVYV